LKTKTGSDPVVIGRVGSPSGLRGEFRVTLYAQDSDNLKEGKVLLLKHAENEVSARIERVRYQKDRPVIKLEGFDDRTSVEPLRNMEISIEANDLEELPEGEHYVRNLIGCRVVDIAGGCEKEIGVLQDVIQNTAQSVLDVRTAEGKSVLIPAVDAFLRNIDEEAGLIEVELIPGFYE
jgi:16S rRNA processing protein RimM